jgi:hypothetical protein
MKRLLLAIAGWMCLAVPAFAQGPQINTSTGIWGVNTSNNQPCVIGILPYVSTCQIPTSGGGGSGGNVTITGPYGSLSQAASVAVALDTVDAANIAAIAAGIASPNLCQASASPIAVSAGTVNLNCDLNSNLRTVVANTTFAATSTVSSPSVTPGSVSTSAFTTGYCYSTPMAFASVPTTGIIGNANVYLASGAFTSTAGYSIDLYLFSQNPSNGTYTSNTAFALNATDAGYLIGVLHLSDCTATNTTVGGQCQEDYQSQVYTLTSGTSLYGIGVVRGTPTFASSTPGTFQINLIK